jgi:hypothetical protein
MQFGQLKRREFISLIGSAAAWPLVARAQQAGKLPTVGFIGASSAFRLSHRRSGGPRTSRRLSTRSKAGQMRSMCAVTRSRPYRTRIGILALGLRLPTAFPNRDYAEAGGLMSYGPNFPDLHRRAAEFVDKILRGAKPADIPVEQPTKFDLIINLTTAKALRLKIPEAFLLRADEVIE